MNSGENWPDKPEQLQPQQEEPDDLIDAAEAVRLFVEVGLSAQTFRRRITEHRIDVIMPKGRKRGARYPRKQVLAARDSGAKAPRKKQERPVIKPAIFSRATVEDMPEVAELLMTVYERIDPQKRAVWIERNPEVAFKLTCEGKIVGAAFLMPLSDEMITRLMTSEVKPRTKPSEIPLYVPGQHYHLYVRAVAVQKEGISKEQSWYWGRRLILGLVQTVVEMGERGLFIDKISAQADRYHGARALRLLGFSQIDVNAPRRNSKLEVIKNYELDVRRSGTPFVMNYKKNLNEWRKINEEE